MITRDTIVVGRGVPDLTLEQFTQILKAGSSPALVEALACYDAVVKQGVSIGFATAIFKHESSMGRAGFGAVNKNPGNTRSSMTGIGIMVQTVKGPFIRYPSWREGFRDLAWRLVKPDFVYAQDGRRTITRIIERWAPPSDGNDTPGYITAVISSMNNWIGGYKSTMTTLPKITWTPAPAGNFEKGPTKKGRVIIHDMESTYAVGNGWLDNPQSGVSAHYSVNEDGTAIDQSVKEEDVGYHCGNYQYNLSSIGIEHAGWKDQTKPGYAGYQDSMYRISAALVAQICKRNGIIPSRSTIIGHAEVPNPNNPNLFGGQDGHTDPGPGWNWALYMSYVLKEFNGMDTAATPPNIPPGMIALDNPNNLDIYNDAFKDPVTGFQVIQPFCVYYRDNGGLAVFGHPTSGLYGATPGGQDQTFEFGRLWLDKASGKVMAELKDHNNPKGFAVGGGVMAALKAEGLTAISNEDYYTPNKGVGSGLTQRSFTYAQDAKGVTFRVEAIQDQDSNNKPLPTWGTQLWQFVKEVKGV